MLSKILSIAFCFVFASAVAHPLVDFIHQRHLDSSEGRTAFLTEKLAPYVARADQLNKKIQALSEEVRALSAENDQDKILDLTRTVSLEMGKFLKMLPVIEQSLSIQEDFQQIEAILQYPDAIGPEQEAVLQRIISLCHAVD